MRKGGIGIFRDAKGGNGEFSVIILRNKESCVGIPVGLVYVYYDMSM